MRVLGAILFSERERCSLQAWEGERGKSVVLEWPLSKSDIFKNNQEADCPFLENEMQPMHGDI